MPEGARRTAGQSALLPDWRFYILLPSGMFLPLVLTALFLYQVPLAEARGWSVETMAMALVGFAVARLAGALMIGPMIDRFSALRLFPFVVLPAFAGLVPLSLGTAEWLALIYLTLAGMSQGIAVPTMTTLLAEVFGIQSLGATKGTVATIGVLATAIGPVLMAGLLEAGVSFYGGGCQNILSPSTGYPSFCIRRPPLLLSRTGSGLIDLSAQPGSGSCARRALVDHDWKGILPWHP